MTISVAAQAPTPRIILLAGTDEDYRKSGISHKSDYKMFSPAAIIEMLKAKLNGGE